MRTLKRSSPSATRSPTLNRKLRNNFNLFREEPLIRVVVTGLGAITPNGNNPIEFFNTICDGKSGIALITRFDASRVPSKIGGEVKNFDPVQFGIQKRDVKKMDYFVQ